MNSKILNVVDEHLLSNPQFCRGGQNDNIDGTGKLVSVDCC